MPTSGREPASHHGMSAYRSTCLIVAALGCLLLAPPLAAKESNGTAAARALFAQGDALARAGKAVEAAALFRKAITADPDFVDAHQRFIESTQRAEAPASRTSAVLRLQHQYKRWAAQQPKRAVYQWALGFLSPEPDKSEPYFLAALEIDPSFARAHFLLARNADLRGDWDAQRRHLAAAVECNPDDPRYLMKYALAYKRSDAARFRELASAVVQKFPESQAAAEALYHLADSASNPERRSLFEQMRLKYPADKFGYGSLAMSDFYGEITVPSEALSVAREMAKAFPASRTWARRVALQDAMTRAAALIADRNFVEALEVLEKSERPSDAHVTTWALLKAEAAAGAGQGERAYTSLVESAAAAPDARVEAALVRHGTALNKNAREIDADVWRVRDASAKPAPAFELAGDRATSPVQLSDYRGRVVLIAFWFPG